MIRRLLSLLAAHREVAELRVLLDCARADLGSLRRELDARQVDIARLTGAAAAERVQHGEALRACEATWAGRVAGLERDLAASQAECRELNGAHRVLVAERDHAIAEVHAAQIAAKRARKVRA